MGKSEKWRNEQFEWGIHIHEAPTVVMSPEYQVWSVRFSIRGMVDSGIFWGCIGAPTHIPRIDSYPHRWINNDQYMSKGDNAPNAAAFVCQQVHPAQIMQSSQWKSPNLRISIMVWSNIYTFKQIQTVKFTLLDHNQTEFLLADLTFTLFEVARCWWPK